MPAGSRLAYFLRENLKLRLQNQVTKMASASSSETPQMRANYRTNWSKQKRQAVWVSSRQASAMNSTIPYLASLDWEK